MHLLQKNSIIKEIFYLFYLIIFDILKEDRKKDANFYQKEEGEMEDG